MKYTLESVSKCGRLGIISDLVRLNNFQLETPHVLLHTKGGTIPHLTYEVLQYVTNSQLGLSIPVQSIHHLQDQMKIYNKSIADYIGMKEYLTYCSYINPIESRVHECQKKNGVFLWTRNGKALYTVKSYMDFITDLKPDMFLLFADGDSNMKSSQKRTNASFSKSEKFLEECMEIYEKSDSLKSSQPLAAIQGGFNLSLREKSSELISNTSVFGVVIDGLHDCSETVSEITLQDIKPFVEASLKHIPENKLRIIHGCWNPSVVLDLIELGIDLFDSSYLTSVSEQGCAFIFPNTEEDLSQYYLNGINNKEICNSVKDTSKVIESGLNEPQEKKIKIENSKYYVSMYDTGYVTDFSPILKNCTCLACKNHTRAYIHHLLSVKELLGTTLLMMHNLHHYLTFFSTTRKALKCGKYQEMKGQFQNWFNNYSPHS